jgi:hypothetical protein
LVETAFLNEATHSNGKVTPFASSPTALARTLASASCVLSRLAVRR